MNLNEAPKHSVIPRIQCPRCGAIMRLAKIEPDLNTCHVHRITFDCGCGFTYRLNERVRAAHRGQGSTSGFASAQGH